MITHKGDLRYIETSRPHVGRDQHTAITRPELLKHYQLLKPQHYDYDIMHISPR